MTKKCAAFAFGKMNQNARKAFRGRAFEYTPEGLTPCEGDGAHVVAFHNLIADVCGAHKKAENFAMQARLLREPGEKATVENSEEAVVINIHTKEEVVQPKLDMTSEMEGYMEEMDRLFPEQKEAEMPDYELPDDVRFTLTGHADLNSQESASVEFRLMDVIRSLKSEVNSLHGIFGGAIGADWLGARVFHKLGLPFSIYVPTGYEHLFIAKMSTPQGLRPRPDARIRMQKWRNMLGAAKTSGGAVYDEHGNPREIDTPKFSYVKGANFKRNETMVRVSNVHMAVCRLDPRLVVRQTRTYGGTQHGIKTMWEANVGTIHWMDPANSNVIMETITDFGKDIS